MKTDKQAMIEATNLILDIDNWGQGSRHGSTNGINHHCCLGAMEQVSNGDQLDRIVDALKIVIREQYGRAYDVTRFNDREMRFMNPPSPPPHIHAEVIAMMEKAADTMGELGARVCP